jgi:hypothetical protein
MVCPQEFVALVAHLPAQAPALSGVQHVPSDWQTSPAPAHPPVPFAPHATTWPQLFVATPQLFPVHVIAAGSGLHPQLPDTHRAPPSHPPQSVDPPQLSYTSPQRFVQKPGSSAHPSTPGMKASMEGPSPVIATSCIPPSFDPLSGDPPSCVGASPVVASNEPSTGSGTSWGPSMPKSCAQPTQPAVAAKRNRRASAGRFTIRTCPRRATLARRTPPSQPCRTTAP